MREGAQFSDIYHNPAERQIITPRLYEEVVYRLALPKEKIQSNMRVLSAGEGLSNFSRSLAKQTGAQVVALDAGYAIFSPKDTPETARDKIKRAGLPHVVADRVFVTDLKNARVAPPQRDGEQQVSVAGNVYSLPFQSEIFDMVVSTHLLEHIDFGRALPEFLRVVKGNGEIRFGGEKYVVVYTNDQAQVHLPGGRHDPWYQGWVQAISMLGKLDAQGAVHCYGVIQRDDTSGYPRYQMLSFVLKKGNDVPAFSMLNHCLQNDGHHGEVVRLDIQGIDLEKGMPIVCMGKKVGTALFVQK